MDLPLSIVQDLYRIGTLKWISTIKESTDIISLTRNIFEIEEIDIFDNEILLDEDIHNNLEDWGFGY